MPRFVFSDFPLGNPCGKPFDDAMQRAILGIALDLLASASAPRTTVQTPFVWSPDPAWKEDYLSPARGESRSAAKPLRRPAPGGPARHARPDPG